MVSDVFEPFGATEEEPEAQQADGQQKEDRGDVHQCSVLGSWFSMTGVIRDVKKGRLPVGGHMTLVSSGSDFSSLIGLVNARIG